jgi:hypothetical protein
MTTTSIEHVSIPKEIMEKGGKYRIQTTAPNGKDLYYSLVITHGKITDLHPVINDVAWNPSKEIRSQSTSIKLNWQICSDSSQLRRWMRSSALPPGRLGNTKP